MRRGVLGFSTIAQVDRPERADAIRALLGITDASKTRYVVDGRGRVA